MQLEVRSNRVGRAGKGHKAWRAGGRRSSGATRLARGLIGCRSFGCFSGLCGPTSGFNRGPGIRLFLDAHQGLVRNFPTKVLVPSLLLEVLLKKDGTPGIGNQDSGGRQKDIAGAVLHFHTTTQKGCVACHPISVCGSTNRVNSTEIPPRLGCGKREEKSIQSGKWAKTAQTKQECMPRPRKCRSWT